VSFLGYAEGGNIDTPYLGTLADFATKKVVWAYWDGIDTFTVGRNQVTVGASAARALAASFGREVHIGGGNNGADSRANHGSMQVVNRDGLTLAQAKAIVAKMQDLHDIEDWYEADARFVWDPETDTSTAAMNPTIGNALSLNSGAGAIAEADRWSMNSSAYGSSSALTSGLDYTKPTLIALTAAQIGGAAASYLAMFGTIVGVFATGGDTTFGWRILGGGVDTTIESGWTDTDNLNVFWMFYDPATDTLTVGQNQTDGTSQVLGSTVNTLAASNHLDIFNAGNYKLGKVQALSRTGMTLAQAKALVQKMQDAQGIMQWYEDDALFAWDPVTDTDTAAINPIIGSSLALHAGTGAIHEADGWSINNSQYGDFTGLNTGMTSGLDPTKPFLIAATVDRNDQWTAGMRFAQSPFMISMEGNHFIAKNSFRWRLYGSGLEHSPGHTWANPDELNVLWFYYDPSTNTVTVGQNQTNGDVVTPTVDVSTLTANEPARRNVLMQSDTLCKFAKVQVINRTGMTLAQAKAIVQKMQTAQGIA
jgi:hypothetical protein